MSALNARRLTLGNELTELDRLAPWIEGLCEPCMSPGMSLAVQLCLEEVVANFIMYGAINHERLQLTVDLEHAGEVLVARISDNGQEFDPTKAPRPTTAASLKEAKVGNLGIHLIRSFATDVEYERRGGRNHLTLRFIESRRDCYCSEDCSGGGDVRD
jgi:serine/threonine-protein kinase RsbW